LRDSLQNLYILSSPLLQIPVDRGRHVVVTCS